MPDRNRGRDVTEKAGKKKAAKPPSDATGASAPKPAPADDKDVALVLGATQDGSKVAALRQRGDQVEATLLSRVREGEALHGEVVQLNAREEPNLYDVQTLVAPPAPSAPSGRPAQVATKGYRNGWSRIFGGRGRRTLN